MLEEHSGSGGHVTEKEKSVNVRSTNVWRVIASIPYLTEHALTTLMTSSPDDVK